MMERKVYKLCFIGSWNDENNAPSPAGLLVDGRLVPLASTAAHDSAG